MATIFKLPAFVLAGFVNGIHIAAYLLTGCGAWPRIRDAAHFR